MFSAILGGVSALGNLFSGIGSNRTARKNAKLAAQTSLQTTQMNNDAQMALAKYQNQYNLDMWNRQNEYNSPMAQMKRLDDAGLNKALMYGQGNTGNAASTPEAATPNIDYSGIKPQYEVSRAASLGGILKDIVSTAMMIEDYKSRKIANKAADTSLQHQDDYWRLKLLNGWNQFYWKGGIPSNAMSAKIHQALYDKLRGQADFQIGNANFFKDRKSLMESTRHHLSTMDRLINQSIFEFDKTTRPWIDSLGRWYKPAGSAASGLGRLGALMLLKK